jgi:hypothetical protein
MLRTKHRFKSGDVVEVRSLEEIQATLDANGAFEGVPFMEEMRPFCGRRFRVFKRADKICSEQPNYFDLRRMRDAVLLEEVRCDGSAHDGCGRMCTIFWKEAWLRATPPGTAAEPRIDWSAVLSQREAAAFPEIDESKVYRCQATVIQEVTEPLRSFDLRHYFRDVRSGALRVSDLFEVMFTVVYNRITGPLGWHNFGHIVGSLKKTPAVTLDLRPGELVTIRRKDEIVATLDSQGKNRGLGFGGKEMAQHCGATVPVLGRIDRMILEDSGKMRKINNTVLLQGTACSGLSFRGCARNGHPMWREAWLERATPKRE